MALADQTRRAIVHKLTKGEFNVSELTADFNMSMAAVSKHLKVLEQAGIIKRKVNGRVHTLSLVPEALAEPLDWISIYRNFWLTRLDTLADKLED